MSNQTIVIKQRIVEHSEYALWNVAWSGLEWNAIVLWFPDVYPNLHCRATHSLHCRCFMALGLRNVFVLGFRNASICVYPFQQTQNDLGISSGTLCLCGSTHM